jgi:hypothetical protein
MLPNSAGNGKKKCRADDVAAHGIQNSASGIAPGSIAALAFL